jgi:methyltransferase (TIGR00027 family)
MDAQRSSKTAAQMAVSRAIETRAPVADRICDDPFAVQFLDSPYRVVLAARPLRAAVVRLMERLFAGHHHYVLARTRYFDEFLANALTADVRQLVILGAGFDSRAYRFADRLRDVHVFEVDHPATSAVKRAKLMAILGELPANVAFVPVDFNRDTLGGRLAAAGYRTDQRTVFLWEGTVPYLSPAAVDDTLRFVATRSAAHSRLIFDYVIASVLDGNCELRGAATEYARMRRTPEPFVFGIAAADIVAFLAARGFRDVHDADAIELAAHFPPSRREAYVKPWWRIVSATVAPEADAVDRAVL